MIKYEELQDLCEKEWLQNISFICDKKFNTELDDYICTVIGGKYLYFISSIEEALIGCDHEFVSIENYNDEFTDDELDMLIYSYKNNRIKIVINKINQEEK